MVVGGSGAAASVETVPLLTMDEAMTALLRAADVRKAYRPATA